MIRSTVEPLSDHHVTGYAREVVFHAPKLAHVFTDSVSCLSHIYGGIDRLA